MQPGVELEIVALAWRLPRFVRPRCTAGATHRLAESYSETRGAKEGAPA
jgi:hypothetical protein